MPLFEDNERFFLWECNRREQRKRLASMPRSAHQPEEDRRRRSDYGTFKITPTDRKALPFVAEQRFVRYDTLGEWLAPGHEPAIFEKHTATATGTGRGGKRSGLPWPRDYYKRLAAVARLVDQHWVPMGLAESVRPFSDQPRWVKLTDIGLRTLGLPWAESDFPEDMTLYWHDNERYSHMHCINETRIYLDSGGSGAPKHTWTSERAVETGHPFKLAGAQLDHLADGVLELLEPGSWDILSQNDEVLATVRMPTGSRIAIEVELNQKSYKRLSKEILPSLLQEYDFIWYFCAPDARRAVYNARRDYVPKEADRRRLRVMPLPELCKPLDKTRPKERQ
jgi:hypothetical protein